MSSRGDKAAEGEDRDRQVDDLIARLQEVAEGRGTLSPRDVAKALLVLGGTAGSGIQDLEQRVGRITSMLEQLKENGLEAEAAEDSPGDRPWKCSKCRKKVIGRINEARGELRIRFKNVSLWFVTGPGGSVAVVCERCGWLNRITADQAPVAPGVLAGQGD